MEHQIAYDSENGYIHIMLSGQGTPAEVKTLVMECLRLAHLHRCGNFLLDARELVGEDPLANVYQVAQLYEQMGVDRRYREAIIAPENLPTQARMAFFETAAQNRGFQVRLFQTESEAIAWLKTSPPAAS